MIEQLRSVVGRRHLLTDPTSTRPFRRGYRCGEGPAIAVVRPGSLVELWRVVNLCAAHDLAIVMQAANTGLTGGSTPVPGCDRPVVIVNTMRIKGIIPIRSGAQVICLPGATLDELERALTPWDREPHSVIGSSCFGASVVGGICNNSGGSLIQRGPAYTQMALFARIEDNNRVVLVNHLGLSVEADPETLLAMLERREVGDADFVDDPRRQTSDRDYVRHVRDAEAPGPARFNGDPRRLFEASGSSGKLVVLAVRLDTFPRESETTTFYVGTNAPAQLAELRRTLLASEVELPIAAEYIHRGAFDVADRYGRDTFTIIRRAGTRRLPVLLRVKAGVDGIGARAGLGEAITDRATQRVSQWLPDHLPPRIREYRDSFEHHLLLRVASRNTDAVSALIQEIIRAAGGDMFICTADEAAAAFLHRFVVAGAAVRYRLINRGKVDDIVALDYALPRKQRDWFVDLAGPFTDDILAELRYGHFFCHVFHHDFAVRRGADVAAIKQHMLQRLAQMGAACPAEHNVGHLYEAPPAQRAFFRALDPGNQLNPGVGRMSRLRNYVEEPADQTDVRSRSDAPV